ncbi:MAG: ubiquinone-binding protein [Legionellales bacterium]|nr:ubiquinone-binding protein [Legionellales bacterium]|tara:strand:+ start:1037 stop:1468 length:432 start_codon:yes stop_codon:yes gene_type:complete
MPVVHYQKSVNHSADKMYDLVNDVSRYSDFVPFCSGGRILKENHGMVEAELEFTFSGFTQRFTTKNTLIEKELIDIELVNGPFRHLDGKWQFKDQEDRVSLVVLDMDFEVSGFLSYLFEPVFYQISHTLVDVFVQRAYDVYGD